MSQSIWHPAIASDDAKRALEAAAASEGLSAGQIDIEPMMITQHWDRYSDTDHEVWSILFQKRMKQLEVEASDVFLRGLEIINLRPDRVPDLREVNENLLPMTGWQSCGVPGYLPAKSFFAFLAKRRFPTTVAVRPKESMDYLPEPDIIHDVFGHVPLHADPVFAEFLQLYGKAALHTDDPELTEQLARIFWFTVEFGLIREDGRLKLYGSGLISSEGEGRHAIHSDEVERRPFDLDVVRNTSFEIDHYQPILYVLESFQQLRDEMERFAGHLLDESPGVIV